MPKKTKRNERGFAIYDTFVDMNGKRITVQKSSIAGRRLVWIQNEVELCGRQKVPLGNAHLTVPMAKRIVHALQRFIDGEE